MTGRLRVALGSAALLAAVAGSPSSPRAQEGTAIAPALAPAAADPAQAVRVYLSQSLAALAWARRYAESAGRSGEIDDFNVARYLAELDTVIQGLDRYLTPNGPPPGPITPVEITGQFLLEGLRSRDARPADGPRP
jgi:hypothetical protein